MNECMNFWYFLIKTHIETRALSGPGLSITFCIYIGNRTEGTTSDEVFKTLNVSEIVDSFEYYDVGSGKSYNIFHPDQASLSLSMEFNCLTLKNSHQGELNFYQILFDWLFKNN